MRVYNLTGTAKVLHNKNWTNKGFNVCVRSTGNETDLLTQLMIKLETTTFKKTVKDVEILTTKDLGNIYKPLKQK